MSGRPSRARGGSLWSAARRRLAGFADPMDGALALDFQPLGAEAHRAAWRELAGAVTRTGLPRDLVVYVHVPFCRTICSFCALAVERAPGESALDAYVSGLVHEASSWAPDLEGLEVSTVHLGGGTPSLLSPAQLGRLIDGLVLHLPLRRGVEWGVELLPNSTTPDKLAVLVDRGVRRASFGVQSFNPDVLRHAHRAYQKHDDVERAVAMTRDAGINDVNVDVLVGLPGETDESVEQSVRAALALQTRSMSLNRNLAENSPLAAHGWVPTVEDTARTTRRLQLADALVRELRPPTQPSAAVPDPGYGIQYVWAPNEEARAYFQEDMNGPASVLPLGHGATGHLHGMMYMVPDGTWQAWLDRAAAGDPQPVLAARITPRQEMAAHVARAISKGRCRGDAFERAFGLPLERAFGPRLRALAAEGAVARDGDAWVRPAQGRGASYLELLAALGVPAEQLRQAPAPTAGESGSSWAPRGLGGSAVSIAAPSRVAPGPADLVDDPHLAPEGIAPALAAARAAGGSELALWTHPARLTAAPVRAALERAMPDLLMLAVDGPDWREAHAWAVGRTEVALFVRATAAEASSLPERMQALSLAGATRVLVELDGPIPGEVALALWRIASRRRPELAVVFEDPGLEWAQYGQVDKPMPDSILISRIAFRAARANRQRDGGLARFHRRFGRL